MEKQKFLPEFLNIPYKLIIDSSLCPLDLKVYGIILWFRNTTKQNKCFVKNKTIADLLSSKDKKVVEGSVQMSITRLAKLGYIKKEFKDASKRHRKELIPLLCLDTSNNRSKKRQTHQMIGLDPSNDVSLDPLNDGHRYNKISNNNIEINPHTNFSKKDPEKIIKKILNWYYISISKKTTSEKIVLTKSTKKIISGALSEFQPLDLLLAIQGFAEDTWQLQNNGFRGVEWFFSDTKRLSQYIGMFNQNKNDSFIKEAIKYLNK